MSANWIDTRMIFEKPPEAVWQLLPGGVVARNAYESWQYMGTIDGTIHQFRHRAHPSDNGRHYVDITVAAPHRITRHVVR